MNISSAKPKISVIIPIYNMEKYLKKSLLSLKAQTLKEIEFICVNDGSTDKSLEILNKFAKSDERFKIFNQQNSGVGKARNNGLTRANGEYIAFLDPDDWVDSTTYEKLFNQAKKQNCDLLVFNYKNIDENGKILSFVRFKDKFKGFFDLNSEKCFNWRDIKEKVFGGFFYSSWNKIYKKDFITKNKIQFTDCSMSEDNAFVFASTLMAEKIGYNDDVFYNYLFRNSSAVHKVTDKNFCIFKVYDAVMSVIKKCGVSLELKKELDDYIEDTLLYHYKRIKSRDKYEEICKKKLTGDMFNRVSQKFLEQKNVFLKLSEILETLSKSKKD